MKTVYEFLQRFGGNSLDFFWFPLAIWTGIAIIAFLVLRLSKNMNPLYQYHLRVATIAAIPLGLLSTYLAQILRSTIISDTSFESAVFIVENPIQEVFHGSPSETAFNPNWWEPNFLFGVVSFALLVISIIMVIRLITSYFILKQLYNTLSKKPLLGLSEFEKEEYQGIQIAFLEHPLVPFTFGWQNPVIVLPKSIQDDPEKVRMAIQHELVHIKRGDYLLQLFLSVIESLFWFHPLVRFGSNEIETYREISCDQEVLNTTGVSLKSYATMLYELVPLQRGLGSFSVSMAVKQSTLKKRIVTMKNHKLYKNSVKKSMLFLVLMIVGVTLPIACSDMRGPQGLSPNELESATFGMTDYSVTINGIAVVTEGGRASSTGLAALFINANEYGVFKLSPSSFKEGRPAGEIVGNTANFEINELSVTVSSSTNFLTNLSSDFAEAEIWVQHYPEVVKGPSHGVLPADKPLEDFLAKYISPENFPDDAFVVVEQMPVLIGGLASIQSRITYPEEAKREGIEGRVIVQFIVDKNGNVVNPTIVRGIGAGADEVALEAVRQARFEPGMQRGRAVDVQFSVPVIFRLDNSDFVQSETLGQNLKELDAEILQNNEGVFRVKITDNGRPLVGANVFAKDPMKGAATNSQGIATITGLEQGNYEFEVSFIGYKKTTLFHNISSN
ncbi:MAG: TonB family protein [Balneolales bacterium]|nr:TonB family protein [Balneolales bacterium]